MSRARLWTRAILAGSLAIAVSEASAAPVPGGGLASTRALRGRLAANGRATAAVTVSIPDPMGGPGRTERGRLALEPPDRMGLDFPASGERIAVRRDGGEWLQPATRQLVRIQPEQAALASWLWDVFLRGGADRFRERSLGGRRFALTPRDEKEGLPGHVVVTLDRRRLPVRLEIEDPTSVQMRYEFSGWRFSRPRGARAFVLTAPAGYSIVDRP